MGSDEEEGAYEVEDIVDHRVERNGTKSYKIKWAGFDQSENSWVHETNMDSPDILKRYWERQKNKRKSQSKTHVQQHHYSRIDERNRRKNSISSSPSPEVPKSPIIAKRNTPEPSVPVKSAKKRGLIPPPLPQRKRASNISKPEKAHVLESQVNIESTPNSCNPRNVTLRKNRSEHTTPESLNRSQLKNNSHIDRASSSSPFVINGMLEVDNAEEVSSEPDEIEEQCGLERGLQIQEILSIGKQDGETFGCIRYKDYDTLEWVAFSLIKEIDPNAIIHYFERLQFDQMSIDVLRADPYKK